MITRYVNTASTTGGDGTTNNTTGADRAFVKLYDAISSLSSVDDDVQILCCGGNDSDTGSSRRTYDGSYVTSGHSLTIKYNDNIPSTDFNRYYLSNLATFAGATLWIVDGINFIASTTGIGGGGLNITASSRVILKKCKIKAGHTGGDSGIVINSTAEVDIVNCVLQNITGTILYYGIYISSNVSVNIYNSIVRGTSASGSCGILRGSGTVIVKNCAVFDNVNDFNGTMTIDHCASDDGDGTNPISVASWADQFYNANYIADTDFRLKQTSVLLNAGVGPGADAKVPTTDIIGYGRSGNTATVGPYQYYWNYNPYIFPSDPYDGEEHRVNSSGSLYIYDDPRSRWVKSLTSSRGVTGIAGVTGGSTAGVQGLQGSVGGVGAQGATGIQGYLVQGLTGEGGVTGSQGMTGVQGPTGLDPGETGYLNFVFNNPYTGTVGTAMLPVNIKVQSWEVVSSDVCSFKADLRVGQLEEWPPSFVMATGIGMTGVFKDASIDVSTWAGTTGSAHDYITVTVTDTDTPESLTLALGYHRT